MSFIAYTDDGRTVPSALGRRLIRRDEIVAMIPAPSRDPNLVAFEIGEHMPDGGVMLTSAGAPAQKMRGEVFPQWLVREEFSFVFGSLQAVNLVGTFCLVFDDGSWIDIFRPAPGEESAVTGYGLAIAQCQERPAVTHIRGESFPPELLERWRDEVAATQAAESSSGSLGKPVWIGVDPGATSGDECVKFSRIPTLCSTPVGAAPVVSEPMQIDRRMVMMPCGPWLQLARRSVGEVARVEKVYEAGPNPRPLIEEMSWDEFDPREHVTLADEAGRITLRRGFFSPNKLAA